MLKQYNSSKTEELWYLMVQVEQYGFDEEVSVIIQPRFEFYDVSSELIPDGQIVAVNQAAFGERFLVPADHDILINFAPTSVYPERRVKKSYMGRFKLRAWYQDKVTEEDKANRKAIIYWKAGQEEERKFPEPPKPIVVVEPEPKPEEKEEKEEEPEVKETTEEETKPKEKEETETKEDSGKPLPEPEQDPEEEAREEKEAVEMSEEERNSTKVSWTGEVVKDDEPWYDRKLFTIADFEVTSGDVAKGSGAFLVFIGVIVGICMAITYRKRHKIAVEIHRLSTVIRASLKGRPVQEFAPDNEVINVKKITKNKRQREFLNDLFAEQDKEESPRRLSKAGGRDNLYKEVNHDTIENKDESGFENNQ